MILLNNYTIIATSLVIFILLILIIRNWAESRHRLSYKDKVALDKILDKNPKKEIIKEKIVSNTRADSLQNSIPASHKSEQKIKFNNKVLLKNIAKYSDTRHEKLGEKVELPKKESRVVIEERTNKNGRKYYFNTVTRKFAKKEDFIKQQKDDHRVDVSGTNTFSIKAVGIDNQKYDFGLLLLEKKKFKQALYYFSKAIELNPADGAPFYYRGIAKEKLILLNDAIEDYTDAMLQKLNIVDVFYKRGYCKFKLGDNNGALKDFTKYVSIDKHNPEAYYYKGLLEYDAENYSIVLEDLDKAIELNPNHESAYFKRGMAKEKTDDKKGCLSDLKIAIDKGNLEAYHYLKKFSN